MLFSVARISVVSTLFILSMFLLCCCIDLMLNMLDTMNSLNVCNLVCLLFRDCFHFLLTADRYMATDGWREQRFCVLHPFQTVFVRVVNVCLAWRKEKQHTMHGASFAVIKKKQNVLNAMKITCSVAHILSISLYLFLLLFILPSPQSPKSTSRNVEYYNYISYSIYHYRIGYYPYCGVIKALK